MEANDAGTRRVMGARGSVLSRSRISFALQSAGVFLVVVWQRQHVIRQPWAHNPDEGELLVAGKRAVQSIIPYDRFTTTSYGPLWPMTLAALHRLGFPLSLPMAHALAALLFALTLVGVLFIARRLISGFLAFCMTLVIVVVWASGGYPRHPDFMTLATELAPVALITLAMCVVSRSRFRRGWVLVAMALIGAAPLFKYQFGFISVAAAAVVLWDSWRRDGGIAVSWVAGQIAAFLVPSVVILVMVTATGRFHIFIDEGLASITGQINAFNVPLSLRAMATSSFLLSQAFFLVPAFIAAVVVLSSRQDVRPARRDATAVGLVVLIAYASVIGMSYRFVHYSYIVLCSSIVAAGLAVSLTRARSIDTHASWALCGLIIGFAMVLGISYSVAGMRLNADRVATLRWTDVLHPARSVAWQGVGTPDDLSRLCPIGSSVFVWGWAGELYSYYDWQPVSRYTISPWITNRSTHGKLYADRLINDLKTGQPRCLVEAIGRSFHGSYTKKNSLMRTFPALRSFVARDYRERVVTAAALRSSPTIHVFVRRSP